MAELTIILSSVRELESEARTALARRGDSAALAAWHHDYLSKKGKIPTLLKSVGALKDIEAKKQAGKATNDLKQSIEAAFVARQEEVRARSEEHTSELQSQSN